MTQISKKLGEDALIARINGKLRDLFIPINEDASLQIITFKDKEGMEVFRHSTAHLLAQAVVELFPQAKPTIGPVVEEGFYYDFDLPGQTLSQADLDNLEKKMRKKIRILIALSLASGIFQRKKKLILFLDLLKS